MDITIASPEVSHADETVEVALYDSTGQPETDSAGGSVAVFVVGEYSKAAKQYVDMRDATMSTLVRRYGSWERIPQAEKDSLADQGVASRLTDWRGFESGGSAFPYSTENAVALVAGMRMNNPKALEQIVAGMAGHTAFFTKDSAR